MIALDKLNRGLNELPASKPAVLLFWKAECVGVLFTWGFVCHLVTITFSSFQAGLVGSVCCSLPLPGSLIRSYFQHCMRLLLVFWGWALSVATAVVCWRVTVRCWLDLGGWVHASVCEYWVSGPALENCATGPILALTFQVQLVGAVPEALPTGPQTLELHGTLASWPIIKDPYSFPVKWPCLCVYFSTPSPFLFYFLISSSPALESVINFYYHRGIWLIFFSSWFP